MSLVVFLTYVLCELRGLLIAVIPTMDGNLKDARGEREQREIEQACRTSGLAGSRGLATTPEREPGRLRVV